VRLRQVALVSAELDAIVVRLGEVFGLQVAHNDPQIHHYGLRNAVLPAGGAFLEVIEPIREDAAAARHLRRRGGDAGYMVILQVADGPAEAARAQALGVRVVDRSDRADYYCAHFHPADFGGMLVSFDQQRTETDLLATNGDWMPAGPDWRAAASAEVRDISAITLSAPDPLVLAGRWAGLLGRPLHPEDPLRLPLDRGEVRFACGDGPTLITSLDIDVADPEAVKRRARAAHLDVSDEGVKIAGVWFQPVRLGRGAP